jgi:hypothetical protein
LASRRRVPLGRALKSTHSPLNSFSIFPNIYSNTC